MYARFFIRRHSVVLIPLLSCAGISLVAACAGSHVEPETSTPEATTAGAEPSESDSDESILRGAPPVGRLISAERIRQSGARTAWEALDYTVTSHRFRTNPRGQPIGITADRGVGSLLLREEPLVFLDQTRLGDIQLLHQFPAHEIFSIRILSGADGTTYYGTSAVAGVILIRTIGSPRYATDRPDPDEEAGPDPDPGTEHEPEPGAEIARPAL